MMTKKESSQFHTKKNPNTHNGKIHTDIEFSSRKSHGRT